MRIHLFSHYIYIYKLFKEFYLPNSKFGQMISKLLKKKFLKMILQKYSIDLYY